MTPSRPSEASSPSRLEAGREGEDHHRRSDPLPESGKGQGRPRQDPPSPLPRSIGGEGEGPASGPGRGCQAGETGRVLPDRHRDTCDGSDCPGCEPCPDDHCQTCRRAHAIGTCYRCLDLARTNLAELGQLVGELPAEAINGRQAFHHHHGIPGGDALVMLTPAAPHRDPSSTRPVYAEPGDPRPPLDVLAYWVNVWRSREHLAHVQLPPTMAEVTQLLDGQLHRIAVTPVFPQLAKDLARLLHSVENVLHAGYRPDVSRVPCLSCGTRLVKVWADDPARDHHRCPVCGETYDAGRYERAKHDQLHSRGADRFVPVSDALAVTGRPEQTIRTWMRDGLVTVRRDQTGKLLVWWPDVRDRHRTTPTRRRRIA